MSKYNHSIWVIIINIQKKDSTSAGINMESFHNNLRLEIHPSCLLQSAKYTMYLLGYAYRISHAMPTIRWYNYVISQSQTHITQYSLRQAIPAPIFFIALLIGGKITTHLNISAFMVYMSS